MEIHTGPAESLPPVSSLVSFYLLKRVSVLLLLTGAPVPLVFCSGGAVSPGRGHQRVERGECKLQTAARPLILFPQRVLGIQTTFFSDEQT